MWVILILFTSIDSCPLYVWWGTWTFTSETVDLNTVGPLSKSAWNMSTFGDETTTSVISFNVTNPASTNITPCHPQRLVYIHMGYNVIICCSMWSVHVYTMILTCHVEAATRRECFTSFSSGGSFCSSLIHRLSFLSFTLSGQGIKNHTDACKGSQ